MATKQHCYYCFDVLLAHFKGDALPKTIMFKDESFPLFVTWHGSHELRGCIGSFRSLSFPSGLEKFALQSALEDPRFPHIVLDELPSLSCTVSLLTDFEQAEHYLDWQVGRHGVWIEFLLNGHPTTATYLPEVAVEQKWTPIEAIDSLLRKGGFRGAIKNTVRESIRLTRYQSSTSKVTYQEYQAYKKDVDRA